MDGLGAKYAAWCRYGNRANYIPVNYGEPVPYVPDNSVVFILDFSFPKKVMRSMADRFAFLRVLDHHKTAEEELRGEPYAEFDMNRSGAMMAWNFFHHPIPAPKVIRHIQDRDLWKWDMDGTRECHHALGLLQGDMESWDKNRDALPAFLDVGRTVCKYEDLLVEDVFNRKGVTIVNYEGKTAAVVNSSVLISEIANALCTRLDIDFAIIYRVARGDVVELSLRSAVGKADVSIIAKSLGGGGHATSAGAKVDLYWIESLVKIETELPSAKDLV